MMQQNHLAHNVDLYRALTNRDNTSSFLIHKTLTNTPTANGILHSGPFFLQRVCEGFCQTQ
jgi:hypothetical protein